MLHFLSDDMICGASLIRNDAVITAATCLLGSTRGIHGLKKTLPMNRSVRLRPSLHPGGGVLGLRTNGEVPLENVKSYLSQSQIPENDTLSQSKIFLNNTLSFRFCRNIVSCKEICTKSIEKCGNIAFQAI